MRKNTVVRMDQARPKSTCDAGVCATSGKALVDQVMRGFQYAMPGVEDTEAVTADLALITDKAKHLVDDWTDLKRLLTQFNDHHGSEQDHIDFLLKLMSEADLLLKHIDPDFCAYAEAEDELEQQRQAMDADTAAKQVTEYLEDAAWLDAEKAERERKALHDTYCDHVVMGREYHDHC